MENNEEKMWPRIKEKKDAERLQSNVEICPNCRQIMYDRKDPDRGEWFCQECGYVTAKINILEDEVGHVEEFKEMNNPTLPSVYERVMVDDAVLSNEINVYHRFNGIKRLQKKYERTTDGDMKLWRRLSLYRNYIGIVNTEFMMTPRQKEEAYELIQRIGDLKALHRQCGYEQIVTALCVYVMKKDKRDIRFDRQTFLMDIRLTKKLYATIMENMAKYFEEQSNIQSVTKKPLGDELG